MATQEIREKERCSAGIRHGAKTWVTVEGQDVMDISRHFKFSFRGFSPKRMGYLLGLVSLGFVPVHFGNSSCEQSCGLTGFVFLTMLFVLTLCLFTPRSDKQRFGPFLFCLLVFIVHSLVTH